MGTQVVIARLSQVALENVARNADGIKALYVRINSPAVTLACRQAGMPLELAEVCGGVLASVVDDLVSIGRMRRTDYGRTMRKQRVLAVTHEPQASAFRLAAAAAPINGHAAVAHWDVICEPHELGKLAWLFGMDTETSYTYARRIDRSEKKTRGS